jgi:hypothetical protein
MATCVRIQPEAIYDDDQLCSVLEISPRTLSQARRAGQLQYVRIGTRTLYFGKWVITWLADEREVGDVS